MLATEHIYSVNETTVEIRRPSEPRHRRPYVWPNSTASLTVKSNAVIVFVSVSPSSFTHFLKISVPTTLKRTPRSRSLSLFFFFKHTKLKKEKPRALRERERERERERKREDSWLCWIKRVSFFVFWFGFLAFSKRWPTLFPSILFVFFGCTQTFISLYIYLCIKPNNNNNNLNFRKFYLIFLFAGNSIVAMFKTGINLI